MSSPHKKLFSTDLHDWFHGEKPKTIHGITETFGVRAAPSLIILLMAIPALPLPTGGVSHVMGFIASVVALQMVLGRDEIWVPQRWRHREVSKKILSKGFPLLIRNIKRTEKHSRARGTNFMTLNSTTRFSGIIIILGILAVFFAPPFSGLDTFPSLGVIVLCLGVVLLDVSFWLIGVAIIASSLVLELTIGVALIAAAKEFILHGNTTTRATALVVIVVLLTVTFLKYKRDQRGP